MKNIQNNDKTTYSMCVYFYFVWSIPVKLITHPQPGLFGAAAAYAQQHI
jgi:glucokinase